MYLKPILKVGLCLSFLHCSYAVLGQNARHHKTVVNTITLLRQRTYLKKYELRAGGAVREIASVPLRNFPRMRVHKNTRISDTRKTWWEPAILRLLESATSELYVITMVADKTLVYNTQSGKQITMFMPHERGYDTSRTLYPRWLAPKLLFFGVSYTRQNEESASKYANFWYVWNRTTQKLSRAVPPSEVIANEEKPYELRQRYSDILRKMGFQHIAMGSFGSNPIFGGLRVSLNGVYAVSPVKSVSDPKPRYAVLKQKRLLGTFPSTFDYIERIFVYNSFLYVVTETKLKRTLNIWSLEPFRKVATIPCFDAVEGYGSIPIER